MSKNNEMKILIFKQSLTCYWDWDKPLGNEIPPRHDMNFTESNENQTHHHSLEAGR
jgi:hypothetical protein